MTKAEEISVFLWLRVLTPSYSNSFHMINRLKIPALIILLRLDSLGFILPTQTSPLDSQTKLCFLKYVQIPKSVSILFSKTSLTIKLNSRVTRSHTQFLNPYELNTISRSYLNTCSSEPIDHIMLIWRKAEESGIFRYLARVKLLLSPLLLFTQMNGCS